MRPIFEGVMRVSWSFMALRFSQPRTTILSPLTPTAHVPGRQSVDRSGGRRVQEKAYRA
jgi:hypothetical protein